MDSNQKYIVIDSKVRFGKPTIKGTRISVADVLSWLAEGMSMEEIMEDFPVLDRARILACLEYASLKERRARIAV